MAAPDRTVARARRLIASGLLDREFYSALRGRDFPSDEDTARDWVTLGMPERLTPNPFLDFTLLPSDVRRAWRNGRVQVLLDHLASPGAATGPLGRPGGVRDPAYRRARGYLLERARAIGSGLPFPPKADEVDWSRLASEVPLRVPGRVSVVVPTFADAWMTLRATRSVLKHAAGRDVEVVVVDNGSGAHISLRLAAELHGEERVRLVRLPVNRNFAGGSNVGVAGTSGDTIVFLNNDTVVRRGWLEPVLAPLEDPEVAGVQPLLLYDDDTIQSAGTVFVSDDLLPCHLLVGHPPEDAASVRDERFAAVTGAAMTMRASDVVALRGFDEAYVNGFEDVDLCLRALELRSAGFRVAPTSLVTHFESRTPGRYAHFMDNRVLFVRRWESRRPAADPEVHERLGFTAEIEDDGQRIPAARSRITGLASRTPPRRWSLNLPSTPGFWGDDWGDTHFAESLAHALRDLGQDVVTRRYGAHEAGPLHLDDVHLALRGRHPIAPTPGKINILWVISHPDSIEPAELRPFDLVFAASDPWSAEMSRRSGREVIPLLQATEIDPDRISEPFPKRITEAIFVGNTEGRTRQIVHDAVAAGIPLAVYGRGWDGLLQPGVWRSPYVEPRDLPALYRRHGLVLADHWPDMARNGFVANRVFDAVAAGAMVISDAVAGLEHFPAEVVRASTELAATFADVVGGRPESGLREELAAGFGATHSFARRAERIIEHLNAVILGQA